MITPAILWTACCADDRTKEGCRNLLDNGDCKVKIYSGCDTACTKTKAESP